MATQKVSVEATGIRYGIFASVAMIIYFIVMNLVGLAHLEEVRFMSHAFILIAVVLAIGTFKRIHGGYIPYLPGLGLGFVVGLTAAVLYALFIFVYANFLNPDFLTVLEHQDYYGTQLSPFIQFASIVILGIAVGSMTGYTLMMLYDKSGGEFEKR